MKIVLKVLVPVILLCFSSCEENLVEPQMFGSISGVVLDQAKGVALEGVSITTNPSTSAVLTDNQGKFVILNVPVGSYTVTARKDGFVKESISISVRERTSADASFTLRKASGNTIPPDPPVNPYPSAGAKDIPLALTLHWSPAKDSGSYVIYDVMLYESDSPEQKQVASALEDTVLAISGLKYNTVYYWQVIARDSSNFANSAVWSFRTIPFPDNPILFSRNAGGNYELFSSDRNGNNIVRLTNNSQRDYWPRYSPNRSRIALVSESAGSPQIFVMNRDGSNYHQVTSVGPAGYNNPGLGFCWSNDGDYIIYARYDRLYRINADGTGFKEIARAPQDRHFRECEMSPKGDKIAVVAIGIRPDNSFITELYLMNSDGTAPVIISGKVNGIIESPVFSIDGRSLLYTCDVSGFQSADARQLNAHIFSVNTDGSGLTDLSANKPDGTNDRYPRYSPDGAKIIFTNVPNDASMPGSVYVMDKAGSSRTLIIQDGEVPDWR